MSTSFVLDLNLLMCSFYICMYDKWLLSFSSSNCLLLSVLLFVSDLGLLGLTSGCWITLSIGIYAVVEAKLSRAQGLVVEKQVECPASTGRPRASGQRGFIPPSWLLLGIQMQGDQARLDILLEANSSAPPQVYSLCRAPSSLDLPLPCLAPGLCPQVAWSSGEMPTKAGL